MSVCELCGRAFRSERGLSVHLARVHGVRGVHGRLSVKIVHRFFPLLEKRRWAEADRFLREVEEKKGGDKWIRGYVHALRGMLIALKVNHSPPHPYILEVRDFDRGKLQEIREEFLRFFEKPLNMKLDEGYFQAWLDYIRYLLHQRAKTETKEQTNFSSQEN